MPGTAGSVSPTPSAEGSSTPDATSQPGSDRWTTIAEAPNQATEVAAAAHNRRAWVAGGYDAAGEPLARVQIYDPASDSWTDGPSLPQAVHHASLVSAEGRLYLVGGFSSSFADGAAARPSASVWTLNSEGDGWTQGPPLPEPRGAGAGAWDGERIVYGGGVGPDGVSADIVALTDEGWIGIGSLSAPRQHLGAASDAAGRVWFLGGRFVSLGENTGAVDLVEANRVTSLGAPLTPRSGLGAFWHPSAGACAVGGETPAGTLASTECVDGAGTVVALPPLAVPRHGLGAATLHGVVYALLGGTEPGLYVSGSSEALGLEE